jgi:hypothetical protein
MAIYDHGILLNLDRFRNRNVYFFYYLTGTVNVCMRVCVYARVYAPFYWIIVKLFHTKLQIIHNIMTGYLLDIVHEQDLPPASQAKCVLI